MKSLLGNSSILGGDYDLAQQLLEWVEDKKFRWQRCYQASRDGWGSKDFYRTCNDVGPTVTLVKCGSNIFGGYTDQSWKPPPLLSLFGMFLLYVYYLQFLFLNFTL